MTAAVIEKEPFEVPEGGLASFLTATEGEWSDNALEGAETDYVLEMADKLAGYGREGDTALAHVAPGETVVPLEVLEADPELKNRLFAQMRDMGLDPERYVVGSELNSLNPTTGQPEFFLKKIFKGVKKAVKGVVKVFKQFAPVILSVGLNFLAPGLGAIAAGALGSGIGTLVQGGDLKDAFKSALIGGAVGGITSGIAGVAKGGSFLEGAKGGLPGGTFGGPSGAPAPITEGIPDVVQGAADSAAAAPPSVVSDAVAQAAPTTPITAAQSLQQSAIAGKNTAAQLGLPGGQFAPLPANASPTATAAMQAKATAPAMSPVTSEAASSGISGLENIAGVAGETLKAPSVQELINQSPRSFLEKLKQGDIIDAFKGQQGINKDQLIDSLLGEQGITRATASSEQLVNAASRASTLLSSGLIEQPGLLAKYGPMAGLGLGAMYLSGGFNAPKVPGMEDAFGGMTGSKLLERFPQRYGLAQPGAGYTPVTAADGGAIENFPRRTGPIYGPGTETSDDVPAMLSDGEFVMTARAVRGAGDGSREQGMRRMYDMMRKFEGGAIRGN